MSKNILTQERLKELLHYNPDTGCFTYLLSRGHFKAGAIAGFLNGRGYIRIGIDGKEYQAHRVAFLYITGEFPSKEVDHINHVKTDNRFSNLRMCTRKENSKNRKKPCCNSSGYIGVYMDKRCKKWASQIVVNGAVVYLGLWKKIEDAAMIRYIAECRYGFHKNHGVNQCL